MLVRPITKEEQLQSAQLFAIAFESPFDPNDLTPFAENPCIWAAFDEESGEMMSTVYVTDYRVQFDGGRYKMGGIGGVGKANAKVYMEKWHLCRSTAARAVSAPVFRKRCPFCTAKAMSFPISIRSLQRITGNLAMKAVYSGIWPFLTCGSCARRSFPARSGLHEAAICCCPLSGSSMRGGKRSIT